MPLKLVNATELKQGSTAIIDGASCTIKNVDISKTGKHGASKCRFEAIGIIDGKKRVTIAPGHERFSVPLIEKKKGQILTIDKNGEKVSLMDLESFETIEMKTDKDIINDLAENDQVEYWDVEGEKIVKRKIN